MKTVLAVLLIVLSVHSANAQVTQEQQQEALKQLEVAKAEINTVLAILPGFLKKTIGQSLQKADERITYAQQVLAGSSVSAKFYCVLATSFDGSYTGEGKSELEARQNAKSACTQEADGSEFWCKNTATCEKQ